MTFRFLMLLAVSGGAPFSHASDTPPVSEEIVVVASKLPMDSRTTGRAIAVLDADTIADLGSPYAADLFRFMPGVALSRTGGYGGLTQLRVRGSEANHTVVLIDGVDVSSAGTGELDFSSLLSEDIERVELLRGPQSGLYGSNAMGGVLSVATRSPDVGLRTTLHAEVGEDNAGQYGVSISGGSDRVRGHLGVVQRQTRFDLSQDDSLSGPEDDTDRNQTWSGRVHIQATEHLTIALNGRRTDREVESDGFDFSGGALQGLPVDDDSESDTEDRSYGASATLELAEGRSVSVLRVQRTESLLDGGSFGNEAQRRQINLQSSLQWPVHGHARHQTTVFVEDEQESYEHLYPFDPSQFATQRRDLRGYGVEHRASWAERLHVGLAVRRDDNEGFDDATTYAASIAAYLSDMVRVHSSIGTGVTNPTFFEQFGFVPGQFAGNPNLQPETSKGWDAGVEVSLLESALSFDVTYFQADLEDEIRDVFPSVVNTQGRSERNGVEVQLRYEPAPGTTVRASYTYTDADEPEGGEVQRPAHTASVFAATAALDGRLRFSGGVAYTGAQLDTDFRRFFANGFTAERTRVEPFVLANVMVRWLPRPEMEFYLRLENAFDEEYEERIGYATPGRKAYVGLRYRFGS